jgi:hypothetical protein
MEECNTGITITKTAEECDGNYISTNCISSPNAITYLDLSAGASQTQVNAAITSALMRKDEQISEIPIANGSETKIIAGEGITITGTGTNTNNYIISSTGGSPQNLQKTVLQKTGIYNLVAEDINKSIIIDNTLTEEEAETEDIFTVSIGLPLGVPNGFKSKILKTGSRNTELVFLPLIRTRITDIRINKVSSNYEWINIEKVDNTDNFIINGELDFLPV